MTKKIFFLQFFSILLIFVLPPLFALPKEGSVFLKEATIDFSSIRLSLAVNAALSIFLYTECIFLSKAEPLFGPWFPQTKKKSGWRLVLNSADFFVTLGLLFLFSAAFKILSGALGLKGVNAVMPKNFLAATACAATLLFSAFYEEVLYRGYLPHAVGAALLQGGRIKKAAPMVSEAICIILFSFGHIYSGILPVLNAILAGIVLRRCAKRTGGIITPFLAHFAYNAAAYLFSCI